jgi:hypothetical protein
MKDSAKLLELAKQVYGNPSLKPLNDGTTFCNVATQFIAEGLGYTGFRGLMANQMVDLMTVSDMWKFVEIEEAQALANNGTWVVAGERGETHGHVCTIIPGEMVKAGHWNLWVPICVNIGKTVDFGKGINWAFHDIPKLCAWRSSI